MYFDKVPKDSKLWSNPDPGARLLDLTKDPDPYL
jgi:hypothetical protein